VGDPALDVAHADGGACLASVGNLALGLWEQPFTRARLRASRRMFEGLRARAPGGVVNMTVLVVDAFDLGALADDGVRNETIAIVREMSGCFRAAAAVVLGDGFGAAAIRSAGAGVVLFARPSYPVKTFAEVETAAAWLTARGAAPEVTVDVVSASIADRKSVV
jgi:hypothetical protein